MARQLAASTLGATANGGTYFYRLALLPDSAAAVVGSDDVLRLFDPRTLRVVDSVVGCHRGVTCLEAFRGDGFATAGRDGRVTIWDRRGGRRSGGELIEPRSAGFSALACRNQYIAAGTESTKEGLGDVTVLLYDVRRPDRPLRQYTDSHTDTITQLKFHPTDADVLLSGSTDGLVSVFDTRQGDEDEALKQVLNPRSAVHCTGFLTPDSVYVLSSDEQFWIYGLDKSGATTDDDEQALPVLQAGDVREKLQCMYVVDLIHINSDSNTPALVFGHNERKTLALAPLNPPDWTFGAPVHFLGAHGEEVVRDLALTADTAVSCGEDGHVRVWSLDRGGGAAQGMDVDDEPKPSKKQSRKDKKTADRFAPY